MDLKIQSTLITNARYRNNLLEAGIVLLLIVLLGVFVIRPKYSTVNNKSEELEAACAQLQSIENDRSTMNRLIQQMKESGESVALVDQALPLHGRVTSLNLLIDNLVATSGMKLASIATDESEAGIVAGDKKLLDDPYAISRDLQTTEATLSVTGPVEQFRQLLILIENSPRLIDIENITISSQEGAILYTMSLKSYFYAPEYPKSTVQQ